MSINLPSRKLVSQDDQSLVERPDIPRSRFIGSWTRKTTFDAGYIVPFLLDEVYPGDVMKYNVTAYVRLATPLFPIFDNQRVDTFFFFVPNRIVWNNWTKFMGEQEDPSSSIDYTIPDLATTDTGGFAVNSIYDHYGLPTVGQVTGTLDGINALPFRGYNLIYNEWFRDQNLQDSLDVSKGGGGDSLAIYALRRRAKSHDYFTSCLPWPQKFTAPSMPLGGAAPVLGIGVPTDNEATIGPSTNNETGGGTASYTYWFDASEGTYPVRVRATAASDGFPNVWADLSEVVGGVNINDLRNSFLVQQLLEKDARGGTRYVEKVKMHFGVTVPDFRVQRPEYIGGGSTPLNITPIAQTAPTSGQTVGWLGAAGTAAGQHNASYAVPEHGFIHGFINVRSELSYSQGLHRMWTRTVQHDFYFPSLAGLGEQAVLRKEIYCIGDDGTSDNVVFGYQERFHELRTRTSEVTGMFRPTTTSAIDQWHLSQEFSSAPTLGSTFIQDTPPMARVLAAGDNAANQQYLADILIQRDATRPLPMYGTPVMLGRF